MCDPLFPSSTLKLWDYSKGKVSSRGDPLGRVYGGRVYGGRVYRGRVGFWVMAELSGTWSWGDSESHVR